MNTDNPKDLIYWGIFLDDSNSLKKTLEKKIIYPHVTYGFKTEMPLYILGEPTTIEVVGYAIDNNNEGYSVRIPEDPYGMCRNLFYLKRKVPHITTSVSAQGKPVDTKDLKFQPIEPFVLTGRFGYFSNINCIKYSI